MRLRPTVLLLAGVTLAPALAAQTAAPARKVLVRGQVKTVEIGQAKIGDPRPILQKVELKGIPSSWVKVDRTRLLWAVAFSPPPSGRREILAPVDGLYLRGTGFLTTGRGCSTLNFTAELDLKTIRAHGFRLSEVQNVATPTPSGFGTDLGSDDLLPPPGPVHPGGLPPMREWTELPIQAKVFGNRLEGECTNASPPFINESGSSAPGINPLTGQKIVPPPRPPN